MDKLVAVNENGARIGEGHPRAKLLDSEVEQVIALHEAGLSYSQIADKMDLSKSGVAHMISGRRRCQVAVRLVRVSVPA